ncbi:unnamed protein product, partial [Polarella glacialis]
MPQILKLLVGIVLTWGSNGAWPGWLVKPGDVASTERPPQVRGPMNETSNFTTNSSQPSGSTERPDPGPGYGMGSWWIAWDFSAVLEKSWFSKRSSSGTMRTEGGWILYLLDASGTTAFGDFWPTVAGGVLVLLGLVIYALSRQPVDDLPEAPAMSGYVRVDWAGPATSRDTDSEYFSRQVKGRGSQRRQNDLLVIANQQAARVQGDTSAQWARIDRHGLAVKYQRVLSSRGRGLLKELDGISRLHLCRSQECGCLPGPDTVHVKTYAAIDAGSLVDIGAYANFSPCRCITLLSRLIYRLAQLSTCGIFTIIPWLLARRQSRKEGIRKIVEGGAIRALDPESESEREEEGDSCAAIKVGLEIGGRPKALAPEGCQDKAQSHTTKLLSEDIGLSDLEGKDCVHLCSQHEKLYQATYIGRKCSVMQCYKNVKGARQGVQYCKHHLQGEEYDDSPAPETAGPRKGRSSSSNERPPARGRSPNGELGSCLVRIRLSLSGEAKGWYCFLGNILGNASDTSNRTRARVEIPAIGVYLSDVGATVHVARLHDDHVDGLREWEGRKLGDSGKNLAISHLTALVKNPDILIRPHHWGWVESPIHSEGDGGLGQAGLDFRMRDYDRSRSPPAPAERRRPSLPPSSPHESQDVTEDEGLPSGDEIRSMFDQEVAKGREAAAVVQSLAAAFDMEGGEVKRLLRQELQKGNLPTLPPFPVFSESNGKEDRPGTPKKGMPEHPPGLAEVGNPFRTSPAVNTSTWVSPTSLVSKPLMPGGMALFRRAAGPNDTLARPVFGLPGNKAGAMTGVEGADPEGPPDASAQRIVHAIEGLRKAQEEERAGAPRGTLGSLRRAEELDVYLARGCGTLTVEVCVGLTGKELFLGLKRAAEHAKNILQAIKWPVLMTNRIAFALASFSWVGASHKDAPLWSATASGFVTAKAQHFDCYVAPSDHKLEAKGRYTMTFQTWRRQVENQIRVFGAVYGLEHMPERMAALKKLEEAHDEDDNAWPADYVFALWEELSAAWREELRESRRQLCHTLGTDNPRKEDLRFVALSPNQDGQPNFAFPTTWDMENPHGYYQLVVVPRQDRAMARLLYSQLHKTTPKAPAKAGEIKPDDSADAPGENRQKTAKVGEVKPEVAEEGASKRAYPAGKRLLPAEGRTSLEHAPKCEKSGMPICWDAATWIGCQKGRACQHAHEPLPGLAQMHYTAAMQLIRRGGLRSGHKIDPTSVDGRITQLREQASAENREKKAPKKTTPKTKAGWAPPAEYAGPLTEMEGQLQQAVQGPDEGWLDIKPPGPEATQHTQAVPSHPEGKARHDALQELESEGIFVSIGEFSHYLQSHVRARILNARLNSQECTVEEALWDAARLGHSQLVGEAEQALEKLGSKAGGLGSPPDATLSPVIWLEEKGYGVGQLLLSDGKSEERQRLPLHVAAAIEMGMGDDWTTDQIQKTARAIRRELWDGAAEAQSALGDAPPWISTSEADLRMFAHDCLCASHEKDYRVIMAFPGLPEEFSLLVLRLTAWGHLEADLLRGRAALAGGPIGVVTIHKGNMRALIPQAACSFRVLFQELLEHQKVAKEMEAVGWRSFLEATPAESPLVPSKRPACLRCQETAVAPDKVGTQTKRHPWLDEAESANEEAGAQPLRMRPAWAWGPKGQEVFSGPEGWTQGLEANDIPCDGPIGFHEGLGSHEPWQHQDLRSQEVRARLLSLAGSMPAEDVPNTWQFSAPSASYADANADTGTRTWDNPEGDGNLKSEEDGNLFANFTARCCETLHANGREFVVEGSMWSGRYPKIWDGELMKTMKTRTGAKILALEAPLQPGEASRQGRGRTWWLVSPGLFPWAQLFVQKRARLLQKPAASSAQAFAWGMAVRAAWEGWDWHAAGRAALGATESFAAAQEGEIAGSTEQEEAENDTMPNLVYEEEDENGGGMAGSTDQLPQNRKKDGLDPSHLTRDSHKGLDPSHLTRDSYKCGRSESSETRAREYLETCQKPYSNENVQRAVELGNNLVKEAGSVMQAATEIKTAREEKMGNCLKMGAEGKLKGLSELHRRYLEANGKNGVSSRRSTERFREKSKPHSSAVVHQEEMLRKVWKDAQYGGALLCSDEIEEILRRDGVVESPAGRAPKMNPDRTISAEGRGIYDMRGPNKAGSKHDHPPAAQPRHRQVARLGLWWRARHPKVRIPSTKRDVSRAFKWHHLDPEDVAEFAMRLAGIIIISLVMTFGWRGSPGEYMRWAWAAKAQHESYTPPNPETNDIAPYVSKWLMDDAVILEPDVGVRAHLSMEVMERAMIDVWGDLAINAEKKEEEGDLAETQLLWGLFMDFANFTVSLPDPKRIKAKYLLAEPSLRRGCRELKIKLAQELRGSAQYWTTAQPELHPELAVLDLMLNQAERSTWVNPKGDERTVEDRGGGLSEKKYMAENAQGLLAIIQAETGAVEEEHIIISVVEFLTFIAFAAAEAGNWHDKIIHYVTDNDNVRAWLNKSRTKNRLARHLIRLLQRLEMENRFTTTGLYIRTYRNELNDWLTREDEVEVHRKMAEDGWTRVPSPMCWLETVRDASRHVLRLSGEMGGPAKLAAQLAHTAEAIPGPPQMRAQGSLWDGNQGTMSSYARGWKAWGGEVRSKADDCHWWTKALSLDPHGAEIRGLLSQLDIGRPIRGILVDMPHGKSVAPIAEELRKRGYAIQIEEYLTTQAGERSARRRRCVLEIQRGGRPDTVSEGIHPRGLFQAQGCNSAPLLVPDEVGPECWLRAGTFERDPRIATTGDPLLPRPVGHFRDDRGKKFLVHSPNGPTCGPNTTGGYPAGRENTLLLIEAPGFPAVRKLDDREIWRLQGGDDAEWERDAVSPEKKRELMMRAIREPGWQSAQMMLAWAEEVFASHSNSDKAGGCVDPEEEEAKKALEAWFQAWSRNPNNPSECLPVKAKKEWICPSHVAGGLKKGSAPKARHAPPEELVQPADLGSRREERMKPSCSAARVPGGLEFLEEEAANAVLCKLAEGTRSSYVSGWKHWVWFRSGTKLGPYLEGETMAEKKADESWLLWFVVFLASVMAKSEGTIRQKLFALRYAHLIAAYPDPLANKTRLWAALAGIKRNGKTVKRKLPVTPEMLLWIWKYLDESEGRSEWDKASLWCALVVAWFFLLRASEYLVQSSKTWTLDRVLRGLDFEFLSNGVRVDFAKDADECVAQIRQSKTDQYNQGTTRNHYRTGGALCPLKALEDFEAQAPAKFRDELKTEALFTYHDGHSVTRENVTSLVQLAAVAAGFEASDCASHSLRIGGATALYHSCGDLAFVQRFGRWKSDAFHGYLWEAHEPQREVAKRMAGATTALLKPRPEKHGRPKEKACACSLATRKGRDPPRPGKAFDATKGYPGEGPPTFYESMGVDENASHSDVMKAYKRMALVTHPDKVPEASKAQATKAFQGLQEMKDILIDPGTRAVYDAQLLWARTQVTPKARPSRSTRVTPKAQPSRNTGWQAARGAASFRGWQSSANSTASPEELRQAEKQRRQAYGDPTSSSSSEWEDWVSSESSRGPSEDEDTVLPSPCPEDWKDDEGAGENWAGPITVEENLPEEPVTPWRQQSPWEEEEPPEEPHSPASKSSSYQECPPSPEETQEDPAEGDEAGGDWAGREVDRSEPLDEPVHDRRLPTPADIEALIDEAEEIGEGSEEEEEQPQPGAKPPRAHTARSYYIGSLRAVQMKIAIEAKKQNDGRSEQERKQAAEELRDLLLKEEGRAARRMKKRMEYLSKLSERLAEYERRNPTTTLEISVNPRKMDADLARGLPVWEAHRANKARKRSARHRLWEQDRARGRRDEAQDDTMYQDMQRRARRDQNEVEAEEARRRATPALYSKGRKDREKKKRKREREEAAARTDANTTDGAETANGKWR